MKETNEVTIEALIRAETEKRIEEMAQPGYEFPARINKADMIAMVASVAVSLGLILLCMTGVIQ